jgi:hypothetical protein
MSFHSGSTDKLPAKPPRLGGFEPSRLATNEQARPVPYLAGTQRVGLTYLGQAFNLTARKVKMDVKKSDVTTGYNYFASFAALIGHGPLDKLLAVYFDDDLVWEGELERSGDYVDFTIEGKGDVRLYWGTESQTADTHLAAAEAQVGERHPAYRGQAYLVFKRVFIGFAPVGLETEVRVGNYEVVVGRYPQPDWLTASANSQLDANPVAILNDWITHPRAGLGLDPDRLDTDSLEDVAAQLNAECVGLSPVVNRQQSARQLLVQLCEHFDGYLNTLADGRLTLGLVRGTEHDTLPVLDETDLLAEPRAKPGDWQDTANQIYVKFTNRLRAYKEDAEPADASANQEITGAIRVRSLDRPWITRPLFAAVLAAIAAARASLPTHTGTLRVRASRIGTLRAGDRFLLNYGHWGLCNLPCQITEINRPSPSRPEVEISYLLDRSDLNGKYFSPALVEPPPPVEHEPEPVTQQALLELPFTPDQATRAARLAFLAARPTELTTRLAAHYLAGSSYRQVQDQLDFVLHATLDEDYPRETALIDDAGGLLLTLDGPDTELPAGLTLADALNDELLAHVVYAGETDLYPAVPGTGGTETYQDGWAEELLSLFDAQLVGPGQYRVAAVRGRFDTGRRSHAAGAHVFLFRRRELQPWTVDDFAWPVFASRTWKLQPFVLGAGLDLSDATPISRTIIGRGLLPLAPVNLRGNGTRAPSLGTGQDLVLTWDTRIERARGWQTLSSGLPRTVLQWNVGGSAVFTETLAAGVATRTFTAADLLTHLGSLQDFSVRIWHERDGITGLARDQIKIIKL